MAMTLSVLELQITERIESLVLHNDRLRSTRSILRRYLLAVEKIDKAATQPGTHKASSDMEEHSSSRSEASDLESILALARETRVVGTGKDYRSGSGPASRASAADTAKRPARQSLREALSSKPPQNGASADTACPAAQPANRDIILRDDVRQQLLFLARYRIAPTISACYGGKERYCEQAKFLSKAHGRAVHPRSMLFQTMASSLPVATAGAGHTYPSSSAAGQQPNSILAKLLSAFAALLTSYERYAKTRLGAKDFKASQLSAEDRSAIIALWLRGRKLLELHEHYVKRRDKLRCHCQHCGADRAGKRVVREAEARPNQAANPQRRLHENTALYTPLPLPSASDEADADALDAKGQKSKGKGKGKDGTGSSMSPAQGYSQRALQRVQDFHQAYRSRVMLIAESAIGQEQLKGTIHQLRSCCEEQSRRGGGAGDPRSGEILLERWVSSLKQYRAVYNTLLHEARDLQSCVFIRK